MKLVTAIQLVLAVSVPVMIVPLGCTSNQSCSSLCSKEPSCPGTASSGNCEQQCEAEKSACASSGHASQFQSFLNCAASASFTCTPEGPQTSSCTIEALEVLSCVGNVQNNFDAGPFDSGNGGFDSSLPGFDSGRPGVDSGVPVVDSSLPGLDTGAVTDSTSPLTCAPGSLGSFSPVNVTNLHAPMCSQAAIKSFIDDCLSSTATTATCTTWQGGAGASACEACLITGYSGMTTVTPGGFPPPAAQSPWGPLIQISNPGPQLFVNLGACIAMSDPANTACGTAFTESLECEYQACATSCTVPSTGDPTAAMSAYQTCSSDADQGVCATYANTLNTACASVNADAGPASFCLNVAADTSDNGPLAQLFALQCGGGDGG